MKIRVYEDALALSLAGAQMIAETVRSKPDAVLGLATGSTPILLYGELARMHREDGLDFSKVRTFNLDEYVGLDPVHIQSYRRFMNHHLFEKINIPIEQTFVPDGRPEDVDAHCAEYERKIVAAGGIDLQVLGIGSNGHIGFNEPDSPFDSRTGQVDLTEETLQANSRFFKSIDEVPKHAITMGIGTILESRKVLLLSAGSKKVDAITRTVRGPADPHCPATALALHKDTHIYLDGPSASGLNEGDFERA